MTIVYKAFDGKLFQDEEECQEYEEIQVRKVWNESIIGKTFWSNEPVKYEINAFFAGIEGVICKTPEALEQLKNRCYLEDISTNGLSNGPGVYCYDEDSCEWEYANDIIMQCKQKISSVEKLIKLLTNQ